MKRLFGYALMLALTSAPAFAAKNSENFILSEAVTVGSTQLPAANYKVTWTGSGSNAQVTLAHGSVSVTVPAKVVDQKNSPTSVLTETKGGSKQLEAIYLTKVSVVLTSAPAAGQ